MKKILLVVLSIVASIGAVGSGCFIFTLFDHDDEPNEIITNKEIRTVSIVNNTGELMKSFHLYVNEGTELTEYSRENIEDNSFTFEIDEKYDDYEEFTFELIDRFDYKYQKTNISIPLEDNTEIVFTDDDKCEDYNLFKWFVDLLN